MHLLITLNNRQDIKLARKDYTKLPEADVVVRYVNLRSRQGLGTNIFVIGLPGTGKSSTSLRISELIRDERVKASEGKEKPNITISTNQIEFVSNTLNAKMGDVLVIEEVSVLFPSRRAMSSENVDIAKIFDTIRKKKLCIICNAPIWTTIDNNMKAMAHVLIETLSVIKTQGVVVSKFFRIQTNPSSGKIYKHTMQRNGMDVARMVTSMPNSDIWREYELKKDGFMTELYERLLHNAQKKKDKLDKEMGKKVVEKVQVKELTKRELEVHTLYNINKLTQQEVAEKLGLSQTRIGQIAKNILKKANIPREMGKNSLLKP